MKAIKTVFLFIFSLILVSCFEAPEFDDAPTIQFNNIYYGQARTSAQLDSIVVELEFEDGDGDLGLGNEYRNSPYHEYDVFLTDGTTVTQTVRTEYSDPQSPLGFIRIPEGVTGKLVREGDPISGLPPVTCADFASLQILVRESDKNIIDNTYSVTDTVAGNPTYYVVTGRFLYKRNPQGRNIFVKFYRNQNPSNPEGFEEYTWPGCQDFNGRFVTLSDDDSPLSGTLRYTMKSFGFAQAMGNSKETWKMEFKIVDRAFRESNTVTTQAFTLDGIRK